MKVKTILVDDEPLSIRDFKVACDNDGNIELLGCFTSSTQALEFAKSNRVDFALLDIEMPVMNGITLGGELRKLYPDMILIYVTAYDNYAVESVKQKADYYVTKPYLPEDVKDVLSRARLLSVRQNKSVYIRTFGNFDVFVNDAVIDFSSSKSKELLALLVDRRGSPLSPREIYAYLCEDKPFDDNSLAYCRKAAYRLRKELREAGVYDMVIEAGASRRVDTDAFDCDYYNYLAGTYTPQETFAGEYMVQYSWAEVTLASLERISQKRK